jgi:hypothetical protein
MTDWQVEDATQRINCRCREIIFQQVITNGKCEHEPNSIDDTCHWEAYCLRNIMKCSIKGIRDKKLNRLVQSFSSVSLFLHKTPTIHTRILRDDGTVVFSKQRITHGCNSLGLFSNFVDIFPMGGVGGISGSSKWMNL